MKKARATTFTMNFSNDNMKAYKFLGFLPLFCFSTLVFGQVPQAPANLTDVGHGYNEITIRFVRADLLDTAFVIERFNSSTTSYDSIGRLSMGTIANQKLYFTDHNLLEDSSYQYHVAAVNASGYSAYTTPLVVSTLVKTTPSIPGNRSWTAVTSNSNGLGVHSVNPVSIKDLGNNFYSVDALLCGAVSVSDGKNGGNFYESSGETYTKPSSQDIRPEANATWNGSNVIVLKWRAYSQSSGTPDKYETVTYTLNGVDPAPGNPANVQALNYNNNSIQVFWSEVPFATDYIVEQSPNGSTGWTAVTGSPVSYPATNLVVTGTYSALTTYFFRVTAQNSQGVSAIPTGVSIVFAKPNFVLANTLVNTTPGLGAGVIWGDFDNDNDEDLIITQLTAFNGTPNIPLAFRNDGAGNFTSVSLNLDLALNLAGTAGDYDNDGNLDLFITSAGTQNYLYQGNGDFTFTKVSTDLDQTVPPNNSIDQAGIASAWADYDNNGELDLFVGTQSNNGQLNTDFLYYQYGTGTFYSQGAEDILTTSGSTTGVSWADFDNDGVQDIFVTDNRGSVPNRLYKYDIENDVFNLVTGFGYDSDVDTKAFGGSWGDYDNDGFLDLYLPSMSNPKNYLYRNTGGTSLVKQTSSNAAQTKPANIFQTFSSAWGDIDNDGDLDLMVSTSGSNQLFINNGSGGFTSVTTEKFNDEHTTNVGIALADYDKDGFLDVALSAVDPGLFNGSPTTPPVQTLFKNNNAGNGNHWLEVKLVGKYNNKVGIGTRLKLTAGGKTQIREVSSQTGFVSENSLIAHFGIGSSTTVTSLELDWPDGTVMTRNNMALTDIDQIITITEDNIAPSVTDYVPADYSFNVPIVTPIELTFDDTIIPAPGKMIYLYKYREIDGDSLVWSALVTSGTISSTLPPPHDKNKISFTTGVTLQYWTTYHIETDNDPFADVYGNTSTSTYYTFVTHDNRPPNSLSFSPPAEMDKGSVSSTVFSATAVDNDSVKVVNVWYRKIGGGAFQKVTGVYSNTPPHTYIFSIQEDFPDAMGLEYFVYATDFSGNTARFPVASPTPADTTSIYTYLTYLTADTGFPSTALGFGGTDASWKIFTVPFDLGSSHDLISYVLDELTPLKNTIDWRILTYKDDAAWAEHPSDFTTFTRGKGYFINIKKSISIKVMSGSDKVTAPSNNRANLFTTNLVQGWNEIGNPYLTPISWSDVVTYNSLTGLTAQLKTFAAPNYTNATAMQPYEGGFVFADSPVTISIPFSGQTAPGGRIAAVASDIGQDQWQVPLQLQQDGLTNQLSGIGMRPNASLTIDQFDDINPPKFFSYLEMDFPHKEYFAPNFSVDVVPSQTDFVWSFTVNSNLNGSAQLSWDNSGFGGSSKQLYLFDIAMQKPVDMRAQNKYSFNPKESGNFRIYFGEDLEKKIMPDRVMLGKAFPNPTSGVTTIPFTLPQHATSFRVKLDVYDLLGNKVGTLADGLFEPGFYQSQWNAGTANVGEGVYIYRIVVGDENKNVVQSGKIILKK